MSNHDHEGPQSPAEEAALARAWQQASNEQPPPELDAAIIAAARRTAQQRGPATSGIRSSSQRRNRWVQWQPLAAAAAVAGLALVLVQLMPRERDVAPSIRLEGAASHPATAEQRQAGSPTRDSAEAKAVLPAAPAPAPAQAVEPEHERANAAVPQSGAIVPTGPGPRVSTEASAGAPSMPASEGERRAPAASGKASPAAAVAPDRERSEGNAAPLKPADWAARIASLYAAGDAKGAADALREFRAAVPDADSYLPVSLRDWARAVE
jgi:hypothetical protein